MSGINDLPDEILEFILLNLPPYVDFKSCMLTCKRWSQLVRNVVHQIQMNMDKGLVEYRLCWKSTASIWTSTGRTISGRFSHSAVYHDNSMYVFGGGSSTATAFNDLWRFDLSSRQWVRPLSMGTYPSPKACASMVCHNESLILFGGWRQPSAYPPYQPWVLFDELHVYSILENRWTVHMPQNSPPRMASHSATVHCGKMIIFGGYHSLESGDAISNELWILDLQTFNWEKPSIDRKNRPAARYGQYQVAIDDHHLMILGGCGGPNSLFSDAWLLDMTTENAWNWKCVNILNKKFAASQMWCSPACAIGNKLVVLGPTPMLRSDFQMVKQSAPPIGASLSRRHHQIHQPRAEPLHGQPHRFDDNPRGNILPGARSPPPAPAIMPRALPAIPGPLHRYLNANDGNPQNEHEQRMQRNLQLRQRIADDPLLPRRFNELHHDVLDMAAFAQAARVQAGNRQRQFDRDRQLENLRRVEERINQMSRKTCAKRRKRDCLAMFVCDFSNVLSDDGPSIEWQDFKNNGIIIGAPERIIFSSLVAGNGELILFGGLHKEGVTDNATVTNVTNALFCLTVPREVV